VEVHGPEIRQQRGGVATQERRLDTDPHPIKDKQCTTMTWACWAEPRRAWRIAASKDPTNMRPRFSHSMRRIPCDEISHLRATGAAQVRVKRLGQPEDIGWAAICLASDE
jgi:hypothetical protein